MLLWSFWDASDLCGTSPSKVMSIKKISVSFCHWQPFGLRRGKLTLVAFVWLFSTMHFQMSPQVACTRRGIITLVAFVWLFSTVHFQMSPQIACLRGWKLTLVAFVWLFSTVQFQMSPQIACLKGWKLTLVAFLWLFSTVHFQMSPQIACLRGWKLTLVAWLRRNYNKITVCQKANCITKSAFSAFFRLFPPFRLFHPISLLDCPALLLTLTDSDGGDGGVALTLVAHDIFTIFSQYFHNIFTKFSWYFQI